MMAGTGLAVVALTRKQDRSTAGKLRDASAILAGSALLDSAMEHFRGGWHDRKMYIAPLSGLAALIAATRSGAVALAGNLLSVGVGIAGLGLHVRNLFRRPGGLNWNSLFYAAPVGAPGALLLSGLFGLFARRFDRGAGPADSRALMAVTGAGLLGETAEVALLHFRGAFQDPFMVLPVTVPPVAGAALLSKALMPCGKHGGTRWLLRSTSALGFIGTAFHIYGVARNMGGWSNWRQNALAGPPVPAPISFTGLAVAGQAALTLFDKKGRDSDETDALSWIRHPEQAADAVLG